MGGPRASTLGSLRVLARPFGFGLPGGRSGFGLPCSATDPHENGEHIGITARMFYHDANPGFICLFYGERFYRFGGKPRSFWGDPWDECFGFVDAWLPYAGMSMLDKIPSLLGAG